MSEGYQGLPPEDRLGCISAAVVGLPVLLLDLGRVMGDAGPERNELIDRIPIFLPTVFAVAVVFIIVRTIARRRR